MKLRNKFSSLVILLVTIALIIACGGDDNGTDPIINANKVIALNGIYYKGIMGDSTTDKPMQFAVTDGQGNYIPNKQIQVIQFGGDGTIPRSIMTDSTGIADLIFGFSGSESTARIMLEADDTLRVEIYIRADALIPGGGGQGSYVILTDRYSDVKNYLGEPSFIDIFQDHPIIYADYEDTLGLVVMLYDLDLDKTVYDTSSVYGVIVNSIYNVKTNTTPPIGIGSTLDELRTAYGTPDEIFHENPRPATVVRYTSLPATFYCHWQIGMTDTLIEEVHFIEPL